MVDELIEKKKEGVIEMPSGNGTGPMGRGPMTGRRAGFCAGYSVPGYANSGYGRGGRGVGFGRGAGFGRGVGQRWAGASYAYGNPYMAPQPSASFTPKQEAEMLKAEAEALNAELNAINQRVKSLESSQEPGNNE